MAYGAQAAQTVVCVLTGHGLKDPQTALSEAGSIIPCDPDLEALEKAVLS
jgi:threonine synthase